MNAPILADGTPTTFTDFFKLKADVEDVLALFDYSFRIESCELPRKALENHRLEDLKSHLERSISHVSLTNEIARREFLIAPVLMEVAFYTGAKIKVELPVKVDDRLQGTLDYLLRAQHNFLVVEAKKADLSRGFTQLAVELIALDRWASESPEPRFYGAVSVGDIWKFGFLDRREKKITEDSTTYSVPRELEDVMQILVAVLTD